MYFVEDTLETKMQPQTKDIFAKLIFDKECIFSTFKKKSKNPQIRKPNFKNGQKFWADTLPKMHTFIYIYVCMKVNKSLVLQEIKI